MRHLLVPTRMLLSTRKMITSIDKGVESLKRSCCTGGNVKSCSRFGKQLAVPQLVKHRVTLWPSSSIHSYFLKRNEAVSTQNLYTDIHSSIVSNSPKWKQPKWVSADGWGNKIWSAMEYYLAVKIVLEHSTTQINLESVMLSERTETWKMSRVLFDLVLWCRQSGEHWEVMLGSCQGQVSDQVWTPF